MAKDSNFYGTLTVQDLVDFINANPKTFKDGMNTEIISGDFEGNYTHFKHSMESDKTDGKTRLCLAYEMHEQF